MLRLVVDEVRHLIDCLRPQVRPFDLNAIAARLGVSLGVHDFPGPVRGATLDDRVVILDVALRGFERDEVFAHEIAHLLRRRGWFYRIPDRDEELFADQFARQLLLPTWWLDDHDPMSLHRRARVPLATIALQLAVCDRAPQILRDGNEVLCAHCGRYAHPEPCDCHDWRSRPIRARHLLPDAKQYCLASRHDESGRCADQRIPGLAAR